MNFKDQESAEKLRGGYYTPLPIAEALCRWALRGGARRILEPSCGDGAFFMALEHLISSEDMVSGLTIDAIELLPSEAAKARQVANGLLNHGVNVRVKEADFFEWINGQSPSTLWEAVIGNPPYIRYQYFEQRQRQIAAEIFSRAGVPFSKRTNAWVPFVIASVMHLSPGGRLAMVLPAELLHIMHADGLRLLLEQEMKSINIVDIRELVFEGALQGVVLLRAIKREEREFRPLSQPGKSKEQLPLFYPMEEPAAPLIQSLRNLEEIVHVASVNGRKRSAQRAFEGKWTQALLEPNELELFREVGGQTWANPFVTFADVDIGIVTGANKFFVVDLKTAHRYELLDVISPMLARSEFMDGITYTQHDQRRNEEDGKAVLFVEFPNQPQEQLPPKLQEYLRLGEEQELHRRYKCRIRDPWYVVPYIWVAQVSLLKRCHHFPRLVLNEVGAYSTDTAYRIVMREKFRGREKDLVFSFLNSLTFLCAELEGRHYGGGVLELVPSEVEQLLIPLVTSTDEQFSTADRLVRRGVSVEELLNYTDPLILGVGTTANLSRQEILTLRAARNRLHNRRLRG